MHLVRSFSPFDMQEHGFKKRILDSCMQEVESALCACVGLQKDARRSGESVAVQQFSGGEKKKKGRVPSV